MASESHRSVALLPIRPKFAWSIIAGTKKVEFRKTKFRNHLSHVVVYASSPVQKVLGYFEVTNIVAGSPKKLWINYRRICGMLYEEFEDYYNSCDQGIAIEVGKVYRLQSPMPLWKVARKLTVPQSFAYLIPEAFHKVLECGRPECVAEGSGVFVHISHPALPRVSRVLSS